MGAALTVHVISPTGEYRAICLGNDIDNGESFQVVVPAGCWFGADVSGKGDYSLVGCTVAPGFDFADFEIGKRAELLLKYPEHADIIQSLTNEGITDTNVLMLDS